MLLNLFARRKLRTVFFGTPEFSVASLEACAKLFDLRGAVTQPDRPRGRGHKVIPCEVKEAALKMPLPVFAPESLRKDSDELQKLKTFLVSEKIDLFVVLAYGNILPETLLSLPRLGAVNLHASLLPRWRGAAPIQRALETGDNSTGVSLQKMVQKLDAGDVLHEKSLLIGAQDNAETLSRKLSALSAEVLSEYFTQHFKNALKGQKQDESLVTLAAKITKEEALWSPTWTAREVHNKVRAFSIWPQVKATVSGLESGDEVFAITQTALHNNYQGQPLAPGKLLLTDQRVLVGSSESATSHTVVEIIEIKPANKGALRAWDYFQNHAARDTLTLH